MHQYAKQNTFGNYYQVFFSVGLNVKMASRVTENELRVLQK